MSQHADQNLLRLYLAERDVTCPMCTYNLRGLEDGHCPECGEQLSLTVRPASYRLAALIAAIITFAMGFGFCVLIGGWLAWVYLQDEWALSTTDGEVGWTIAGIAIEGLALILLAGLHRKFRRLHTAIQWLIACLGLMVSLVFSIGFFMIVS